MPPRCSATTQVLLPFLYPSCFVANGRAHTALSRLPLSFSSRRSNSSASFSPSEARSRLNPAPDDYALTNFADKAKLTLYAGDGGHGCISFLREAYVPDGPANGGDGGHGGNVYIQAVHGETSLHKLARRRLIRAGRGRHGRGSSQAGPRGDDVVITVPVGTVVTELNRQDPERELAVAAKARRRRRKRMDPEQRAEDDAAEEHPESEQWVLYPGISSSEAKTIELPKLPRRERLYNQPSAPVHLDLSRPTPRPILLAAGGVGGLGNSHFVSKVRPKPMFATRGAPALSMQIELELKLLADVGLVGLPNAGKSTLLRALSNSRARVGDWAFTTLQPNIGTVVLDNNRGRPAVTSYRRDSAQRHSDDPNALALDPDNAERVRRKHFTIADIPGLIEGAHLDRGLGVAFLRHVERAGVLAFVVDLSAGDAVAALKALWSEVGLYAQMREEEERLREREAAIDWDGDGSNPNSSNGGRSDGAGWGGQTLIADYPLPATNPSGLHIAGKPWFVVATKGDRPGTEANFEALRVYLGAVTSGDVPHPSGVAGAWTRDCTVIPVSAINGQGVDRVVHWTVGLLDG